MIRFINPLVHIITNVRNTRPANSTTEDRKAEDRSCRKCRKQVYRTKGSIFSWRCFDRFCGTSHAFCNKLFEREQEACGQEGQEGKDKEGITFPTILFLTLLYIDLSDTYPIYALTNLFMVWKEYIYKFNNRGVYN